MGKPVKRKKYKIKLEDLSPQHQAEARAQLGEPVEREPFDKVQSRIMAPARGKAAFPLAKIDPPKRKAAKHPEQDLQKAIWELYQARYAAHFLMFHPPNGGSRSAREGAIFKTMGVVAGVPDFIGCLYGGVFFAIELKAAKGKLSESQKAFKARCDRFGGEWFEMRTVEEFERWAEFERIDAIAERGD